MSGQIADDVLRQLAAPIRQFHTVKGAVLWYVSQKANRDSHGLSMDGGGGPRSQESIDTANRTFGVISACLVSQHDADIPDDPALLDPDALFAKFADWCQLSGEKEMSLDFAAEREGMSRDSYTRWMRAIEKRLRRRLDARGLLTED